jgi:putative transposase
VLTLLVSRKLLELVIEHADDEVVFPPERWAATLGRTPSRSSSDLATTSATRPPLLDRMAADAQKSIKSVRSSKNGSLPLLNQLLN